MVSPVLNLTSDSYLKITFNGAISGVRLKVHRASLLGQVTSTILHELGKDLENVEEGAERLLCLPAGVYRFALVVYEAQHLAISSLHWVDNSSCAFVPSKLYLQLFVN